MKQNSFKRPIIAITGSAGKTTTKEILYSILKKQWSVFKSEGNMNSFYATAIHKKQIHPSHQAVILEYGIVRFHDLLRHCRMIQPNVGVITNVGSAHIGNLTGSITGVARAKSELIRGMDPKGILFLNEDDPGSHLLHKKHFRGRVFTIGIQKRAHYQARNIQYRDKGMSFTVHVQRRRHPFNIPILGKHNVYNALAAIAVADQLGVHMHTIQAGLRSFQRLKRRLNINRLRQGVTVIDDTFSANPEAMKAAIDVLCQMNTKKRIACLGSMLDLGSHTKKAHEQIGTYLAQKNVDSIYTFGKEAEEIGRAAKKAGVASGQIKHFTQRTPLHRSLIHAVHPGVAILIKGSNGMKMQKNVHFLRKKHA